MKKLFLIFFAFITINFSSAQTQLDDEWISLFDGKTLNGWHTYGKSSAGKAWKAENGILYLNVSGKSGEKIEEGGDIVTDEEFENFHLKLEWKISEGGNSGIIFYVKEDTSEYNYVWETGPEMQILDNDGHEDGKIEKHRAGDLYDLISVSKETVKKPGEWNQVEIISDKGQLDFYMNDEHVLSTTLWNDNWKKLIEGSKFKTMSGFGMFKKGKVSLQDHGNDVWFRNIKIKKL